MIYEDAIDKTKEYKKENVQMYETKLDLIALKEIRWMNVKSMYCEVNGKSKTK